METQVKELQDKAVRELIDQFLSGKKEITMKAPTGSGKTYMMADFMDRMLSIKPNIIFLVSSLSKGELAKQNAEKFSEYRDKRFFNNIKPYLIDTDTAEDESLHIPDSYNVYVLPRDKYKKASKLMGNSYGGKLVEFLIYMIKTRHFEVVLIKDECHIKTSNLDMLNDLYFSHIINISATPKLTRGQVPDVEITEEEAEESRLIKHIEWGSDKDSLNKALDKFVEIKKKYIDTLKINPCMIVQVSNKDKADKEWEESIKPALLSHSDLKWIYIVDKDADCKTNDYIGGTDEKKRIPVKKWKDYAKMSSSTIDIIIFKMVITEGWDIPRACMLYQLRDTDSKQLDEQVIGRVRRNPRLMDFENLDVKGKELALTAWVWGIHDDDKTRYVAVNLKNMTEGLVKVKTTTLKDLNKKEDFDLASFIDKKEKVVGKTDIFSLGRKLEAFASLKSMIYGYATNFYKWGRAVSYIDDIKEENNKYQENYEESMEVNKGLATFPEGTYYIDKKDRADVSAWIWKRVDGENDFAFDSDAEKSWAEVLRSLDIMQFRTGIDDMKGKSTFLWGKNFTYNSEICFEYFDNGTKRTSYPDFVMKDKKGKIHLFEVKSVNGEERNANLNEGSGFSNYTDKVRALMEAYKYMSKVTDQCFYLPIKKDNGWQITCYEDGNESQLSEMMFRKRFV